jgi:hAT family dimerisation domain.
MLADPERLFLGAKITISNRRNRLSIYTVKALECLKSWLKIKVFLDDNDDDRGLKEEDIQDIRGGGAIKVD